MNRKIFTAVLSASLLALALAGCSKTEELDETEIESRLSSSGSEFDSKTQYKPWQNNKFNAGKLGGTWNTNITSDPKTFNMLIAERDGESTALIEKTLDYLSDYEPYLKEWIPHLANHELEVDEKNDKLTVHYTIRDEAYWTWYGKTEKVPVTSNDVAFWFNVVNKVAEFQSSGYGSHYVEMDDGTEAEINCIIVDDKRFDIVFPRIVADPLLHCNMNVCPSFIFEKAYKEGGVDAVKSLFSIDTDPKEIPSCGKWYITEYTPGQRVVYKRNPNYWEKDENGVSIPYYEEMIAAVIGDQNTEYLLFQQGKLEAYTPRPEEVSDLVNNQKDDYTVFRADGSMGAGFWSFNQNPKNKDKSYYKWFTKKEFRQAMSCVLNRDRIASQTYRGLAEAKYDFFPEANPMYNPEITLQYRYDLKRAEELLANAGFEKKSDGFMYDQDGVKVEFDLHIPSSSTVNNDIALIACDEAKKIGVTINIRQIDFQKLIEMLTATYDWESIFIALGSNLFPTQGSNVWPSYGNLHLWNPLQEKPETEWEARIDELYKKGSYTVDKEAAKLIWDEYQQIILEECPLIYLMRSKSFFAIQNRWDLTNVYYDNRNGTEISRVFLTDAK